MNEKFPANKSFSVSSHVGKKPGVYFISFENKLVEGSTRREFLTRVGKTSLFLAGAATGILLNTPDNPSRINKTEEKILLANKEINLQEILDIPPFTNQRIGLEYQYLVEVLKNPTLDKIDKGLQVSTDLFVRSSLLDVRYNLRKEKSAGLSEIPQDKLNWISEQRIHPEILGICLDNYERAKKIIQQLIESKRLRDDGIQVTADEAMINPGGMASLIATETAEPRFMGSRYAFTYIGEGLSINELNTGNPNAFPSGIKDLETLCKEVSRDTGLTFSADKIAGSKWPEKKKILEEESKKEESKRLKPDELKKKLDSLTTSGGAISIQFMPNNALKIYNLVKEVTGQKLNVFDVNDATVMAWVYLALHEKSYPRYGYRRNFPIEIKLALEKWNPKGDQIDEIYEAAVDYYNTFIGNGKYKF